MTDISNGVVYLITNMVNGKIYVGQTRVSLKRRIQGHKDGAFGRKIATPLYYSIRKHGWDNFVVSILEEGITSLEELNVKECEWIVLLDTRNPVTGYNLEAGGTTSTVSDITRAKISATKKGMKRGPYTKEHGEAISAAKLASGYIHTPETIIKIKEGRAHYSSLPQAHKDAISEGVRKTRTWAFDLNTANEILTATKTEKSDTKLARKFNTTPKSIWRIRNMKYDRPGMLYANEDDFGKVEKSD